MDEKQEMKENPELIMSARKTHQLWKTKPYSYDFKKKYTSNQFEYILSILSRKYSDYPYISSLLQYLFVKFNNNYKGKNTYSWMERQVPFINKRYIEYVLDTLGTDIYFYDYLIYKLIQTYSSEQIVSYIQHKTPVLFNFKLKEEMKNFERMIYYQLYLYMTALEELELMIIDMYLKIYKKWEEYYTEWTRNKFDNNLFPRIIWENFETNKLNNVVVKQKNLHKISGIKRYTPESNRIFRVIKRAITNYLKDKEIIFSEEVILQYYNEINNYAREYFTAQMSNTLTMRGGESRTVFAGELFDNEDYDPDFIPPSAEADEEKEF
jgi:hypothetical protein